MDGAPVFGVTRAGLPAARVLGFRGVLNSTTNYILTRMESAGLPYAYVFAEADTDRLVQEVLAAEQPADEADTEESPVQESVFDTIEPQKSVKPPKLKKKYYEAELAKLQTELVKLQSYVKEEGLKVVVIFEGRDAAGKGGSIKRITESLNPRVCRVVALPAPTEREKTQWYFQRYIEHLPAAGEMVLLDRSWYNRAGVERVMGFCTDDEYWEFMRSCPEFERMLVRSGIILMKYWFSVSDEEQERRFQKRVDRPEKRWKLSPMDLQSRKRWVEYSKAKDVMFAHTDIKQAPWYVVDGDNKKRARLNVIHHLLGMVPYQDVPREKVKLPKRQPPGDYQEPVYDFRYIPENF